MSEKDKALENAMAQIDRQFGKGSIMRMSDYGSKMAVESIPTGSIALDVALGGGGVPRGRVVEIYGPESSGKTTLCYHIMAEAQKLGGVAAYIDAEHAFDPEYASRCGLNLDNLLISQPDNGEQALEIAETLVRSNAIDVIVVDSVAALVPRAEIEGEMGDSHVGLMARLMSQALRKLVGAVSKSHCCLIFTNQIRMKIGVMYGNPETTTGGQALKFYASVRMEIRRVESIKAGTDISGNRVKVKVAKNKVAPPFRTAEFDIMFNEGISRIGSLVDMGAELGVLKKSGAFYSYGDQRLGQGRENVKEFLRNNPEIADEIDAQIRASMLSGKAAVPVGVGAASPSRNGKVSEEEDEGEF
ncbi:MAG TPA: recombinase RecA [Chloroflexia bacterium]|nr:recombinase RecA [Chloroflexia bacterium]